MNIIVKILLTLFLINFSAAVQTAFPYGSSVRFDRLTVEDGLSAHYVTSIIQDQQGFIWIGTSDGLNRFDGYKFTVYRHDPANPNSLSSSSINAVLEDKNGVLWIGSQNGLNRFDTKTGVFKRYLNDNTHRIRAFCEDAEGFLWLGTRDKGLYCFNPGTETFTQYQADSGIPGSLSSNSVEAVYEDSRKTIWVGTLGGLEQFDPKTKAFVHFRYDPQNPYSLSHNSVLSIYEDKSGALWIGTAGGVNRLDRETGRFERFLHDKSNPQSINHNTIGLIREDSRGMLWMGTVGSGINSFDRKTQTLTHYRKAADNPDSLIDEFVMAFAEDHTGMLWFGTANGISRINPWANKFPLYRHYPGNPDTPGGGDFNAIFEDAHGIIWIGMTGGGLDRYDPETGRYVHYVPQENNPDGLSNGNVIDILEDRSGSLWICTWGGGLNRFDPADQTFTRYQFKADDPKSISSNVTTSIVRDNQNRLWIGTWEGGLNQFDPETGTFTRYRHEDNNPDSLGDNRILDLFYDKTGALWICLVGGGLAKYVPETDSFIHFQHKDGDPESISHPTIRCIHEDRDGILWIGTIGGGINRFDRKTEKFKSYTTKNGLPDNTVMGILEDDSRNLWISTNRGLSRFDPRTETFRNYDTGDGLQGMSFRGKSFCKSRSGELWFGGNNGLNRFYPDDIKSNPHIPPVVLIDFKVSGLSVKPGEDSPLKSPINAVKEIVLSSDQSKFSFEFAALDFNYPKKNRYAYMMEGFDKDWIYTGSSHRTATYTNLDPGQYVFRVRGSNNDGLWNEEGVSVNIIILPPWWKTWWFRIILTGLVFMLFFSLHRWRVYAMNQRNILLEHQVAERTGELRESESLLKDMGKTARIGGWEFDVEIQKLTWTDEVYRIHELDSDYEPTVSNGIDFYAPESRPVIEKAIRLAVDHGKPFDLKLQLITAKGNPKWVHAVGKGLQVNGKTVKLSGTFQDITEQMRAEQEILKSKEAAEAANRAKSTFLASMSHELRTPLNGILGYVQILGNDASLTPRQKNGLNVIGQSGRHLLSLINDVLDLAKVESGKIDLYETEFHLPSFLGSVGDNIRVWAEQKGIAFRSEISDALPETVRADERRLRQVLLNLLGNAMKFTDKGTVTLRVVPAGNPSDHPCNPLNPCQSVIRFEVEDTGAGVSSEDLKKIFDPFQQAGDVKRRTEGAGLGLAISRNLVKLMGGALNAESRPGAGSRFWFEPELTVIRQKTGQMAKISRKIVGIKDFSPTILIVDDNPENRAVFRDLLLPAGFVVAEEEGGSEGLATAIDFEPEAVITDLIMPETDGFELIRQIRQHPVIKDTVIIAASASVYEEDHRKSTEAGANAFLPKPVDADRLFDLLQRLLNIEWEYEACSDSPDAEKGSETFILPPDNTLKTLLDLADVGDVEEILNQLDSLVKSDESFRPFAERLQKSAKGFKLNDIRRLIREYTDHER